VEPVTLGVKATTTVQRPPTARVLAEQPSEVMLNPVPLIELGPRGSGNAAEVTLVTVNVAGELDPTVTVP
jgi:hypothetical protein